MAIPIVIIGKRAKALQKANPRVKWKTLHKQATSEYNSGKLGKATKKAGKKHKAKGRRVHGPGRGIDNPIIGAMGTGIDNHVVGRVKRKKRRVGGPGTGIDNPAVGRVSRHKGTVARSGVTVSHLKSAICDKLITELAAAEARKYAATKAGPHNKAVKRITAIKKELRKYYS
jgi:hypothetical protein